MTNRNKIKQKTKAELIQSKNKTQKVDKAEVRKTEIRRSTDEALKLDKAEIR